MTGTPNKLKFLKDINLLLECWMPWPSWCHITVGECHEMFIRYADCQYFNAEVYFSSCFFSWKVWRYQWTIQPLAYELAWSCMWNSQSNLLVPAVCTDTTCTIQKVLTLNDRQIKWEAGCLELAPLLVQLICPMNISMYISEINYSWLLIVKTKKPSSCNPN